MTGFPSRPIAYVRLPAPSLVACENFCGRLLGLESVRRDAEVAAYRTDERAQTLVFSAREAAPSVGIDVNDAARLELVADRLSANKFGWTRLDQDECDQRRVRGGIATADSSDNCIEFVTGVQVGGRRFCASRDSGVTALSAVGLRSRAMAEDLEFWTTILGAEISDRVGDITYLRMDGAHHRIALYPSARNGILYVSLAVQTHDHLMQNSYFLTEHQVRIVHGPGREAASERMFLRFVGPNEQLFALEYDEQELRPAARPRQFEFSVEALCSWGSRCDVVTELTAPVNRASWSGRQCQ